jgi:DNA-binding NarL/FixJ family response regulator
VTALPSLLPGDSGPHTISRVVLIDARQERRAIMSQLVERCPLLTVVGLAASLSEAEAQIRAEQADVALVEIQMPVTRGLATIGALREQFPNLRIVVCSFHDNSATREAARIHGADGYLTKPLQVDDLLVAVTP